MPKIPYKAEKSVDGEDYEIVSFEDFCDKSPGKENKDLLSLNDNINYRLCYESDKSGNVQNCGEDSRRELKETSLTGSKSVSWKRKNSSGFSPFGKIGNTQARNSFLSGVIPKPKSEGESSREHRYQRFSERKGIFERLCEYLPGVGSGVLLLVIVCVLSVGVWWAVYGLVGDAWSDEHYKRLWSRAHPDHQAVIHHAPAAPPSLPGTADHRYHDHNNLSTKNKLNITETAKKKSEYLKKSIPLEHTFVKKREYYTETEDNYRFDCYPLPGANKERCIQRGCWWNTTTQRRDAIGKPYCFYPPDYMSYHFLNMTENKHGMTVYYELQRPSGYPGDFEIARMDIRYLSNDVLQIKISDSENNRFESPYPEISIMPGPINYLKYRVVLESTKTGFKVVRIADNVTLMDSQNVGGLILSDKLLQISAILPSYTMYGLGERLGSLLLDMNWKSYTIFNYDTPPTENSNLYGSHPFYLSLEESGSSHGVLMLNSHPMDIVLQPTPAITYRTIGGILNFFIFLGPTPGDVISQYTSLVGRPFMPPYWSLGFHLCKFNYGSLNATREVWYNNSNVGLPLDVQWNDLDYMNNSNDFTYDHVKYAGLPEFVKELHESGMKYIPLIDAGVSASEARGSYPPYDRGLDYNIFIKNSYSLPFVGKVWNKGSTVWPDFTHPNASSYWLEMMDSLHKIISFDGAWIDMNEPSNFLNGPINGSCEPENYPYMPRIAGHDGLKTKTLCMEAQHYAGKHFDWHNLHALMEAIATNFALTELRGKRPFVISRSSFVGLGRYSGHWSGDINSDWHDMRMSIPELLSFSLFGVPMMGSDICGFRGNTTLELCKRWMQLGAFYPFSRNHNSDASIPQDPFSLGRDVLDESKDILRLRYTILPYLYTLFWRAHLYGDTVARPMFFEFVDDFKSHNVDTQFMLGRSIMIVPILTPGATTVKPYLPKKSLWCNIRNAIQIQSTQNLTERETVLVRSGSVLVLQMPTLYPPVNTHSSRSMTMQIFAVPNADYKAKGEIYWDDGESINSYEERKYSHVSFEMGIDKEVHYLNSTVHWWGYGIPVISKITLALQTFHLSTLTLNGRKIPFVYTKDHYIVTILNLSLSLDKPFTLLWTKDLEFHFKRRFEDDYVL